ncbi:hypothetical protein M409DRAFT_36753 [Zasmidium cellare ATCC 36951]|uniref:Flavin prenyltransferase PAD1, mitochondrial n=1 Tax=Zasmidium cellare ATCC 36951 TaxID=1080233 RepID=A0A6A6CGE5_ZASCE|nr:uncharacterized protein M409DRAFT_36753 [Zasmidium cellare ATCC 36951]KAF2166317.1 hypothetical protein M409DRAFT_36753 [Zasmidium cellare ATCC 36951]
MTHNQGHDQARKQIVVAMTGATGQILGIKTLQSLRGLNVETHLIMSHWAETTLKYETDYSPANVRALADHTHSVHDMAAPVSSGSFKCDGMIIVPCSAKSLGAIAAGYGEDLIARTADVMLKERRRLILAVRESPYSLIHLRNMATVTEAGGVITSPVPAFYTRPDTIDDLIDQWIGRTLDLVDLDTQAFQRWKGWEKD